MIMPTVHTYLNIVGIATCYWLDVLRIESCWGRDFQHLPKLVLGPT
jgi:hypothetical protein